MKKRFCFKLKISLLPFCFSLQEVLLLVLLLGGSLPSFPLFSSAMIKSHGRPEGRRGGEEDIAQIEPSSSVAPAMRSQQYRQKITLHFCRPPCRKGVDLESFFLSILSVCARETALLGFLAYQRAESVNLLQKLVFPTPPLLAKPLPLFSRSSEPLS